MLSLHTQPLPQKNYVLRLHWIVEGEHMTVLIISTQHLRNEELHKQYKKDETVRQLSAMSAH